MKWQRFDSRSQYISVEEVLLDHIRFHLEKGEKTQKKEVKK
jgi:hypothetical protein